MLLQIIAHPAGKSKGRSENLKEQEGTESLQWLERYDKIKYYANKGR